MVLAALFLAVSTHGALALDGPLVARSCASADDHPSVWARVNLCNGISKHTRTICCGTNPPAWCGKRQEGSVGAGANDRALTTSFESSANAFASPLRDPMFYVCILASVTVIYLTALAGSGRDNGVDEAV
jgi:hypothetical protein